MPSIAASDAVRFEDRVLPQHQSALTLIRDRVESPARTTFRWLDLGCGRGQLLLNAQNVLGNLVRKIHWTGIDVNEGRAVEAQRTAEQLFTSARTRLHICDLQNFEALVPVEEVFDFITFTNTLHEISPRTMAEVFAAMLCRTTSTGEIYMYDMESLPELELGAVPWTGHEMREIVTSLISAADEPCYRPEPATWPHHSCKGWSLHLNRNHMSSSSEQLMRKREAMIESAGQTIAAILHLKSRSIHAELDCLCRFGDPKGEDAAQAARLLCDYWSVSRVLDGVATPSQFAIDLGCLRGPVGKRDDGTFDGVDAHPHDRTASAMGGRSSLLISNPKVSVAALKNILNSGDELAILNCIATIEAMTIRIAEGKKTSAGAIAMPRKSNERKNVAASEKLAQSRKVRGS